MAAHCTAMLEEANSGLARTLSVSVYPVVAEVELQSRVTSLQTIMPSNVLEQVAEISPE